MIQFDGLIASCQGLLHWQILWVTLKLYSFWSFEGFFTICLLTVLKTIIPYCLTLYGSIERATYSGCSSHFRFTDSHSLSEVTPLEFIKTDYGHFPCKSQKYMFLAERQQLYMTPRLPLLTWVISLFIRLLSKWTALSGTHVVIQIFKC